MDENLLVGGIAIFIMLLYAVIVLVVMVVVGFVWWRIAAKTGFGGPWGLLVFVPLFNLVLLILLAVSKWPIERELEELRARLGVQESAG